MGFRVTQAGFLMAASALLSTSSEISELKRRSAQASESANLRRALRHTHPGIGHRSGCLVRVEASRPDTSQAATASEHLSQVIKSRSRGDYTPHPCSANNDAGMSATPHPTPPHTPQLGFSYRRLILHSEMWLVVRCAALSFVMAALAPSSTTAAQSFTDEAEFFERSVRPLLVEKCWSCHGNGEKNKGGLRLTSRANILKGGDSGPAAVAGDIAGSLMIQAVRYDQEPKMPPKGKLPDREIDVLSRWVAMKLPWPESSGASTTGAGKPMRKIPNPDRGSGPSSRSSPSPFRSSATPRTPNHRLIASSWPSSTRMRLTRSARRSPHPDPARHVRLDRSPPCPRRDRRLPHG